MSIVSLIRELSDIGYTDQEIDQLIADIAEDDDYQGDPQYLKEELWNTIQDTHERRQRLIEDYENDPYVQAGWAQQDLIDMYRREF